MLQSSSISIQGLIAFEHFLHVIGKTQLAPEKGIQKLFKFYDRKMHISSLLITIQDIGNEFADFTIAFLKKTKIFK
jgi:Ca2+-binding EF-hand superfamily protein